MFSGTHTVGAITGLSTVPLKEELDISCKQIEDNTYIISTAKKQVKIFSIKHNIP